MATSNPDIIEPQNKNLICSDHQGWFVYNCDKCSTRVCLHCVTSTHKSHPFSDIVASSEEFFNIATPVKMISIVNNPTLQGLICRDYLNKDSFHRIYSPHEENQLSDPEETNEKTVDTDCEGIERRNIHGSQDDMVSRKSFQSEGSNINALQGHPNVTEVEFFVKGMNKLIAKFNQARVHFKRDENEASFRSVSTNSVSNLQEIENKALDINKSAEYIKETNIPLENKNQTHGTTLDRSYLPKPKARRDKSKTIKSKQPAPNPLLYSEVVKPNIVKIEFLKMKPKSFTCLKDGKICLLESKSKQFLVAKDAHDGDMDNAHGWDQKGNFDEIDIHLESEELYGTAKLEDGTWAFSCIGQRELFKLGVPHIESIAISREKDIYLLASLHPNLKVLMRFNSETFKPSDILQSGDIEFVNMEKHKHISVCQASGSETPDLIALSGGLNIQVVNLKPTFRLVYSYRHQIKKVKDETKFDSYAKFDNTGHLIMCSNHSDDIRFHDALNGDRKHTLTYNHLKDPVLCISTHPYYNLIVFSDDKPKKQLIYINYDLREKKIN